MKRRASEYWRAFAVWLLAIVIPTAAITIRGRLPWWAVLICVASTAYVAARCGVVAASIYHRKPRAWIETTREDDEP